MQFPTDMSDAKLSFVDSPNVDVDIDVDVTIGMLFLPFEVRT